VIVALIPGYNEAPRIGAVIREARQHLPVIVVDDGSSDGTADVAREAGATVVEQRPNQGKGAALRAGFRRAIDDGATAILTLDADGQHDPREIPSLPRGRSRRSAAGSRDRQPQLPGDAAGPAPLERARPDRVLVGGRPARSPTTSPATGSVSRRLAEATLASDEHGFAFEVEQITTCIRMGGRSPGCPSGRSTPASPRTSGRSPTSASSSGSSARRGARSGSR
jgi:glycosyltransferase involved in cell wall biosynthesis